MICRRCQKSGLHWKDVEGRWRLYDHLNQAHVCTSAPKPVAEPLNATERILLGWRKEALKLPEKVVDYPPMPIDYLGEWWSFLDKNPPHQKHKSKHILEEMVP